METPKLIQDLGMLYATEKSKRKSRYGIFECQCGKQFKARHSSIKDGRTQSCGCLLNRNKTRYKHGYRNTKIYSVWISMKNRVLNNSKGNYEKWKNYGGRGITICDEWRNDFMAFYDWAMANGYKEGLTIDRIDNDGSYEPDNCRWTTQTIQARNKRKLISSNSSGYKGVSYDKNIKRYTSRICVEYKDNYLGVFKTAIEAAKAYDKYVIDNNLEHTINGVI